MRYHNTTSAHLRSLFDEEPFWLCLLNAAAEDAAIVPRLSYEDLFEEQYKKAIFLDIDGVFNSLGKIEDLVLIRHDWGIWRLTKENADFLRELAAIDSLLVIWSSTWQDESNELNRFLGIEAFSYVPIQGNKRLSLKAYLMNFGDNILIVDDDEDLCLEHLYQVNGMTGLTEDDSEYIRTWLN